MDNITNRINIRQLQPRYRNTLLVIGAIIFLVFAYFLGKYLFGRFGKDTATGVFINELNEDGLPIHNAKEVYDYKSTIDNRFLPYIPEHMIQERNGTQSSYSFWIYIDGYNWNYRYGEWKHIWHRGSDPQNHPDLRLSHMRPAFWLLPTINRIMCVYTTERGEEKLYLNDVEMNRWFQICVVLNGRNVGLYRNGLLEESIVLQGGEPRISKDNIYVNYYGGFAGSLSNLEFYDRSLLPEEIQEKYRQEKRQYDGITERQVQQMEEHEGNGGNGGDEKMLPLCPKDQCPVRFT